MPSRFYGLPVPAEVAAATTEGLTDVGVEDLVAAHLGINYSYFGAIDKTLAGFVILDDEGDNYTLLDLRGDGRVWWQDHETRELSALFDTFEDWRSFRAGSGRDADAYRSAWTPPAVAGPAPATTALCGRYQWLVWLLAQPLRNHDGRPTRDDESFARTAIGQLRAVFPSTDAALKTLHAELPSLAGDPHLAIYWLLHTTMLAWADERARVLAAITAPGSVPLVDAFTTAFGALALDGDVPVVPGFRARRALAMMYAGDDAPGPVVARTMLAALQVAPAVLPLVKYRFIGQALADGTLTADEVAAAAGRALAADPAPGVSAVLALLDARAGRESSPHADAFARGAAGGPAESSVLLLNAMNDLTPLVRDTAALTAVLGRLLAQDPYHRRVLALVRQAQANAGADLLMSAAELAAAEDLAERSAPILQALRDAPAAGAQLVTGLAADPADPADAGDAGLADAVARRVLHRAGLDNYEPAVTAWAMRRALAGDARDGSRDGAALAGRAFEELPFMVRGDVLAEVTADLAAGLTGADHPFVPVLLRVLADAEEPDDTDFVAMFTLEEMKESVLLALAPLAHEPPIFDALMELTAGSRTTVDPLWNKLFDPLEPESYVLPRLSAAQAVRVAEHMVACKLTHPDIHARNAAGHQLYRFNHPGAEEHLIAALDEHGRRYATATPGDGPVLDHGQTPEMMLEKVVADLYSAVRNLGTPRSRAALVDRLFTERRSFWRMGSAIGDVFGDDLHRQAIAKLRERRDGFAAGCYAFALADFVRQGGPKVELLREIAGWPVPAAELPRRFFKYALVVGIDAALDARDYDLVRTAHAVAAGIAEAPLEPDQHARGNRWTSPLETAGTRKQLAEALSGAADERRRRLLGKGVRARAAGRPRRRISDRSLGIMAGVTVGRRLLHDRDTGEVWFLDADSGFHAFDGFEIAEPAFRVRPVGAGHMPAFLAGLPPEATDDERGLWWDPAAEHFAELIRYGDRLLYHWGRNNAHSAAGVGLVFPGAGPAAAAFAQLRASLTADGLTETSPWYVPGKGAVLRTYHVPGGAKSSSEHLEVFDGRVRMHGPRFATEAEAIAEHSRAELAAQRTRDAHLSCLEWRPRDLRPEDLTVRQWIEGRIRDDSRDAAWHLRALTDITGYLRGHGYGDLIATVEAELGPGAGEEELAAFEAARHHRIPAQLRDLWREIGSARWSIDGVGLRLLSPAEVLRQAPAAAALGETFRAALPAGASAAERDRLAHLDILVETLDGATAGTVVASLPADRSADRSAGLPADRADSGDDGAVFANVGDPGALWWQRSLSWTLAAGFLELFAGVVIGAAPIVAQLYHGQPLRPEAERRRFELRPAGRTPRYWELFLDPDLGLVSTRTGRTGAVGAVRNRRYTDPARAVRKAAKLVAARTAEGYRETS